MDDRGNPARREDRVRLSAVWVLGTAGVCFALAGMGGVLLAHGTAGLPDAVLLLLIPLFVLLLTVIASAVVVTTDEVNRFNDVYGGDPGAWREAAAGRRRTAVVLSMHGDREQVGAILLAVLDVRVLAADDGRPAYRTRTMARVSVLQPPRAGDEIGVGEHPSQPGVVFPVGGDARAGLRSRAGTLAEPAVSADPPGTAVHSGRPAVRGAALTAPTAVLVTVASGLLGALVGGTLLASITSWVW